MSVSSAAALTTRPLNRISGLDPKERVTWLGSVNGDAGGGNADVGATFADNRAFIILWARGSKVSVAADETGVFLIDSLLDEVTAAPQLTHADTALLLGTIVFTPLWVPPPILFFANPANPGSAIITMRFANSAVGDNVTFVGEALMFDLQEARNIPGAQYWPYRQV